MRVLDRYIARELVVPFGVALGGFLLMSLGNVLFLRWPDLAQAGATGPEVLRLLVLSAPQQAVLGLPFSILVATAWALNRLGHDSELVALRTCGVSMRRILAPTLAVGLLASGLAYLNAEHLAPWANHRGAAIVQRFLQRNPVPQMRANVFMRVPPDYTLYIGFVDGRTHELKNALIFEATPTGYPTITTAPRGQWRGDRLTLFDGARHEFDRNGLLKTEAHFASATVNLRQALDAWLLESKTFAEMTTGELRAALDRFSRGGGSVSDIAVAYHFRFSLPLASFIAVLLAAPLSVRFSRAHSVVGLLLAFVLAFAYSVLMSWSVMLAQTDRLPPLLAAWSPNAIFAGLGAAMLFRQD